MEFHQNVFVGTTIATFRQQIIEGKFIDIDNESYYMIANSDQMAPFFMNIVSDSNHWMFISSNGGLTAGRKNAEYALFPYYTDDKITESTETTGSKTIFLVHRENKSFLWEPFSVRYEGIYKTSRNLYKNIYGNKIIFEEINHDLELSFRYQWSSADHFGFIKKSTLVNHSLNEVSISVLDGLTNLLPYGVGSDLQNGTSNLVDAYKRSELVKETGLGIYALSAIIVDKAEPSEALKANMVWSLGMDKPTYLLSASQLNNFRNGLALHDEIDVKAEKGSYFISAEVQLAAKAVKEWMFIADVNQTQSSVIRISERIRNDKNLLQSIYQDIETGTQNLIQLIASSDGLQLTADKLRNVRHYSNTLFNIMRGGIFDHNYQVVKLDFVQYLSKASKSVYAMHKQIIDSLPATFNLSLLQESIEQNADPDFKRLCSEYLPLKFSRRHGDPSRPWNRFSINTRSETDGSKILDYEGNWRDIFQNWEALAHSYPEFAGSMISKFLNASTFDGYNPYRITKSGFDWETIEPDNPWSYIGYWGDHQIIYLLKLLELLQKHYPGELERLFNKEVFVYANVPYKIKSYNDILLNPKDTIAFDRDLDRKIRAKIAEAGADGALLHNGKGGLQHVTFIEKILATVLAKLSNFIPEGGIWMNTQRPEWNDANNALVGNGVSMVTLSYLRRFLNFFHERFEDAQTHEFEVSSELYGFFYRISDAFDKFGYLLNGKINDVDRKLVLDELGRAASDYRSIIYAKGFAGSKDKISLKKLKHFVGVSLDFIEHSIRANKRTDDLYHSYNLMTLTNENEIALTFLSEMLEGQVAVLSSGYLTPTEELGLLDSLKKSKLYREDQNSYILYPNKDLPGFLVKNNIPEASVSRSELLQKLWSSGNVQLIEKDVNGHFHFNGNLRNARDLEATLAGITNPEFAALIEKDRQKVLQIYEEVFNHKAFTGRSGTFFGYEGLGSIYWHMVSKLQIAAQECCLNAIAKNEHSETVSGLINHYYAINEGIGVHKLPSEYGAFTTDPYSHTPAGKGAKQPGMTGQVKEDILSRMGELGVFVKKGSIHFNPCLLRKSEFITEASAFDYIDINSEPAKIYLPTGSLCFTYCQVPVIYKLSEVSMVEVLMKDHTLTKLESLSLGAIISRKIFKRNGEVIQVVVHIPPSLLQ